MTIFRNGQFNTLLNPLRGDFQFPSLLELDEVAVVGLWVSSKGARSWLHYDSDGVHNLNVQVTGSKDIILFSPEWLHAMYPYPIRGANAPFNFSRVNVETVDRDQFPLFSNAEGIEGTLQAGECLFLPAFWYHSFLGTSDFNTNVNFWWSPARAALSPTSLRSAILFALSEQVKRAGGSSPLEKEAALEFASHIERRLVESGQIRFL